MPQTPLHRANSPKQARSQRTLERILEAAEELVLEKGLASVSVPDIVSRANSSVGGFYARFEDKNELLRSLEERYYERLRELVDELAAPARWAQKDLASTARGLIHALVETVLTQRGLIEAMVVRAGSDPNFRTNSRTFRQLVTTQVTPLILERSQAISHPEPQLGIDLAIQAAFAMMLQHVIYGGTWAAGRELSQAELEEQLTLLVLGLLGAHAPDPPTPES